MIGRKKKLIMLWGCLLTGISCAYSQVGVNTEHPHVLLDVNGDLQLRGEFRVGASTNNDVSVGKTGQYLMSQGPGLPPVWSTVETIQFDTDDYILRDTQFADDRIGIELDNVITTPIMEGELLNSEWTVLEGLTTTITTTKDKNRIMFTTQTVAQSPFSAPGSSADWSSIICGIFIGSKGAARSTFSLIAVRQGYIMGGHYPQLAYTLMSSYEDLPIGEYDVVVAYQQRGGSTSHTSLPLYVGKGFIIPGTVQITNNFMNKSVIRVDVFEPEDENSGSGG